MKEAPSKKLPPKISVGAPPTSTSSKIANDEILSTLLKINNFDSISSIKDESLDIDLSACVTISADSASVINGNSLSFIDFWRMLDENAQNTQLDLASINDEGSSREFVEDNNPQSAEKLSGEGGRKSIGDIAKPVHTTNNFSQFLRPNPPAMHSVSPLKKNIKPLQAEPQKQRKVKAATAFSCANKKFAEPLKIKEEIPEHPVVEPRTQSTNNLISGDPALIKTISLPSTSALTFSNITSLKNSELPPRPPEVAQKECDRPLALYKCIDCKDLILKGDDEFKIHDALRHHILYKCGECERGFEQEAGLKKHMKTHRPMDARKDGWKKCPDCGKCLKLGSMWMHRKIHSDNKKYGCDICGQKFVQKINLTHHFRVHTSEKPYECPECQKRFQERSHLQRHQKYHAQTRSYRCDKCGKMYKTERCLKVHNLVHLEQRPFACNVCDKSFISNSKLKQHSNIHTGERPFKCNYCPRDFTNFPNWLKHTRRRHKVDHKTGEHLENIPSYCSKKSTKITKSQKPTKAVSLQTNINEATPNSINNSASALAVNSPTITTKLPVKRKKKEVPQKTTAAINFNHHNTTDSLKPSEISTVINLATAAPTPIVASPLNATKKTVNPKMTKAKRERKQLIPKQVQQRPVPLVAIKKEEKCASTLLPLNRFVDIHCLSMTSADDLIMEQALEMEESGLYDASVSNVVTDNAISSETAAEFGFKIKHELCVDDIKEEEFISLRDTNYGVLCSSLDSSPYSSPASVELSSTVVSLQPSGTISVDSQLPYTTFYLTPSIALNPQSAVLGTNVENVSTMNQKIAESNQQVAAQFMDSQLQRTQLVYMPMSLSMTLPTQSQKQALPSVDTLLFSQTNASNLLRKGVSAQQNLS